MKVGVIALPGCWDSGLTTVLDVLRTASLVKHRIDPDIPHIEAITVTPGREPVTTAGGLIVPPGRALLRGEDVMDIDVWVIPATAPQDPAGVVSTLARQEVQQLRCFLRDLALEGRKLAAACTGTFVLAEAGVLDNRQATTSWWLSDLFRQRYPKARLDMSTMVVQDGPVTTAGAAFAHIDLAMSLLYPLSPQLAELTASTLLIDDRPSPSVATAQTYLASADRLLAQFEAWTRANLDRKVGVADAATALGVTRRTLERHVRNELGLSPYALIRKLRIERAHHLRRTTHHSLDHIALMVGYQNAASLRTALRTTATRQDPHHH
nr:helix-turn-helix domain-containing protein [Streptomyces chartreusis]